MRGNVPSVRKSMPFHLETPCRLDRKCHAAQAEFPNIISLRLNENLQIKQRAIYSMYSYISVFITAKFIYTRADCYFLKMHTQMRDNKYP